MVRWEKDETLLYNGIDITDSKKYNVTKDGLTINRVEASDAGTYRCRVNSNGRERSKAAELVIIGQYNYDACMR